MVKRARGKIYEYSWKIFGRMDKRLKLYSDIQTLVSDVRIVFRWADICLKKPRKFQIKKKIFLTTTKMTTRFVHKNSLFCSLTHKLNEWETFDCAPIWGKLHIFVDHFCNITWSQLVRAKKIAFSKKKFLLAKFEVHLNVIHEPTNCPISNFRFVPFLMEISI